MHEVLEKVILAGNKTHYFREVNELIKQKNTHDSKHVLT